MQKYLTWRFVRFGRKRDEELALTGQEAERGRISHVSSDVRKLCKWLGEIRHNFNLGKGHA
jgi:hypothetical protein